MPDSYKFSSVPGYYDGPGSRFTVSELFTKPASGIDYEVIYNSEARLVTSCMMAMGEEGLLQEMPEELTDLDTELHQGSRRHDAHSMNHDMKSAMAPDVEQN